MPKIKTRKAVSKRIRVTKSGKLMIRRGAQDHFNSRESGKQTRNKRRDTELSKANERNVKAALPYNT
ncbi:MAG: 50S ribosomal protein L35 [Candidatus Komeilibacteria bacterium]|nr:50S ribosomal protein L35 [Candidatus Komeilibacteria bacterium]